MQGRLDQAGARVHRRPMELLRHTRFAVLAGALVLAGSSAVDVGKTSDGESARRAEAAHPDDCVGPNEAVGNNINGLCVKMLPAETMSGVVVLAFEERSFLRDETGMPNPSDPRRSLDPLEIGNAFYGQISGKRPDASAVAVRLTFEGRRSRLPWVIDCDGSRHYMFVVDRLHSARYLGGLAEPEAGMRVPARSEKATFTRSGEGGVIAWLEDEAIKRCGK